MVDIHLMSESEELSRRNGAAILTVARQLASAAARSGTPAIIAGAEGRVSDEPLAVAAFRMHTGSRNIKSLIGRLACAMLGRPLFDPYERMSLVLGAGDTLYVHNGPWLGWHLRRRANGARVVLYAHNTLMNRAPVTAMRKALSAFDVVLCVSDYVRTELAARVGLDDATTRLVTVRNAAPVASNSPEPSSSPEIDVLYVGRMSAEKGVETLIEAINLTGRELSVTMVGGTGFLPRAELPEFERRLHEHTQRGIALYNWTGPIPPSEVAEYRQRSKVTVVPSLWQDPCPLALLESMASPSATVASASGGMVEFGHLGGVRFVPPGDSPALADALEDLLDHPASRQRNAAKGVEETSQYTWDDAYALAQQYPTRR